MGHEHTGTEPNTARSPLRLRAVLSAVTLAVVVIAGALFIVAATGETGGERTRLLLAAGVMAVMGVIAAVDLGVVLGRLHRGEHG